MFIQYFWLPSGNQNRAAEKPQCFSPFISIYMYDHTWFSRLKWWCSTTINGFMLCKVEPLISQGWRMIPILPSCGIASVFTQMKGLEQNEMEMDQEQRVELIFFCSPVVDTCPHRQTQGRISHILEWQTRSLECLVWVFLCKIIIVGDDQKWS